MNILIVHAGKGFYGGAEEVINQLDNYLRLEGYRTKYQKECNIRGVFKDAPKEMWSHWHPAEGALNASNWRDFRRCVRKNLEWADIINVHNFPATLMPFPTKKPIVWMCNEPPELFTNRKRKPLEAFNRWWVRHSNMKVVVADDPQAVRFERLYGIEPSIVPYGVDYEFWSQGERKQKTIERSGRTFKDSTLRLLQVGTITPYKNQLGSLGVVRTLQDLGIPCLLSLVGSQDNKFYMDCLNFYIRYNNLKNVNFLGQVTHEEVRRLYNEYDILLHPVKGQGGWLVPFEAMCAGIPVVTETGFSASMLIDLNDLGTVSGPGDMASWILDPMKKIDLVKAKEWVKENLTWEKYGEGMLKVFEEAI